MIKRKNDQLPATSTLQMNPPWCWEMIEVLYIDVEQQPDGDECLYGNAVKNNHQIML